MVISAIIPAYNEAATVGAVVNVIRNMENIREVIVVSDGSSDHTSEIARVCGAKVVELPENRGKGAAIKAGLEVCNGDVILLLDADLVGLKPSHVNALIKPVIDDECDMTVGLFCDGRFSVDLVQKITPSLSGQRAVKRWLLEEAPGIEDSGFGMEMELNGYAREKGARVYEVELSNLTHVTKEEKYGLVKGFKRRIKMYWQICKLLR